MADFTQQMRLKGKAEEDLYFAELDRKLIEALHEKQAQERAQKSKPDDEINVGAQGQQK